LKYSPWGWFAALLLLLSACSNPALAGGRKAATHTALPTVQPTTFEIFRPTERIRISPTLAPPPVKTQEEPTASQTPVVLPLDVPIMPDAQSIETSDGRVVYRISSNIAAVDRFYQEKMPAYGWVLSYRNSLPPGKCPGENCSQTAGSESTPELSLRPGLGQIWVKTSVSIQILLAEDDNGTLVTINLFSE
jgi:hypothetical protein